MTQHEAWYKLETAISCTTSRSRTETPRRVSACAVRSGPPGHHQHPAVSSWCNLRRHRFPVTHSGTTDATTLGARDPGAGGLGAPLPRTPPEPLPHIPCREQCRLHWCPAARGCLPIAPPPSSDRSSHYCLHRLRTLQATPHPIASSSPPTGADLAPCRPDPRLLAALMRQHGYRSERGHGRTALLASSGKDCGTTLELSPRPEHRPPRALSCRKRLSSLRPLRGSLDCRWRFDCFPATSPRQTTAHVGTLATRLGSPAPVSSCPTRPGALRPRAPGYPSTVRTPGWQQHWNPDACEATGQEAEVRRAGPPRSRIAPSGPTFTALVSGACKDNAAAGAQRAKTRPSPNSVSFQGIEKTSFACSCRNSVAARG